MMLQFFHHRDSLEGSTLAIPIAFMLAPIISTEHSLVDEYLKWGALLFFIGW